MQIQELVPIGSKTTMRIGGKAHYYAEITTKEDIEEAWKFAKEKNIPLIPLGGGSNTIFANDMIEALVVRFKADAFFIEASRGVSPYAPTRVVVQSGKILPSLINELAAKDLDLSALTGILGTVGGAVFGNAGQGPKGIWIDSFIESVTAFVDGEWKTFSHEECNFRYRESWFKDYITDARRGITGSRTCYAPTSLVIWETTLNVPSRPAVEVKAEIERLLKRRIETQPHLKTAGSCFKALPDGTPAWQLIDAAGLRGFKIGDIQIAEKHANFLLNVGKGSFEDAVKVVETVKEKVPQIAGVEMRFFGPKGRLMI